VYTNIHALQIGVYLVMFPGRSNEQACIILSAGVSFPTGYSLLLSNQRNKTANGRTSIAGQFNFEMA
jgi:hypothetical protein